MVMVHRFHAMIVRMGLLAALLLAFAPAARAGVGLTMGASVGGGTLVGGIAQLQVSRAFFVEADIGYRSGWDVGERYYPNFAVGAGMSATFGKKPFRNGFYFNAASTLPMGFHEAWVSAGWSARLWGPKDLRSFTLEVGPAVYAVRDLPPGTDLEFPGFLHLRAAWHFPLIERGGNESERTPRPERRKKKDETVPPTDLAMR